MPTITTQVAAVQAATTDVMDEITIETARQTSAALYIDSYLDDIARFVADALDDMQTGGFTDDTLSAMDTTMTMISTRMAFICGYVDDDRLTQAAADGDISSAANTLLDHSHTLLTMTAPGISCAELSQIESLFDGINTCLTANQARNQLYQSSHAGRKAVLSGIIDKMITMATLQPLSTV